MTARAEILVARDVDNHSVALNVPGQYSLVMYTNPDLEDTSRQITSALDDFRGRRDFHFVRVVDLRGGLPPAARLVVQAQIDSEIDKENDRLKPIYAKGGVSPVTRSLAPIIPDYSGTTLDKLGWKETYDQVHLVIYDKAGQEVKRLDTADADKVTQLMQSLL